VHPELHIGGATIQTFGICFALAFVAAGAIIGRRFVELGDPVDWSYELAFSGLFGGLVGARLDYIVENWDSASHDLFGSLFSGGGLVWYGGFVGGTIGVVLWAHWRGWLGLRLLDLCAPALAAGYAVGRIGCQVAGDGDYGKPSHLPWAMSYPHGTLPTTRTVQPTPIYETLAMGLIAVVLWHLRDRYRPGVLFAIYLVLAGAERLLVEFVRRNHHLVAGLTIPQLVSIAMIAAGGGWLWARRGSLVATSSAQA
jgi:phosphatidylglycerol:prolipoprotein diacylglycerol transferase